MKLSSNFDQNKELNGYFLGSLTIRPNFGIKVIGKTWIHPKAFKKNDFISCLTKNKSLINGVELTSSAFPNSSQDNESTTCAEVCILNLLEYFGHKFPHYSTILPSIIRNTLSGVSNERQLPSEGLYTNQIAFALKEFNLSVRIYSKIQYGKEDFKNLLSYYIESGIPVIAILDVEKLGRHAVLIIGHSHIPKAGIINAKQNLPVELGLETNYDTKDIELVDTANIHKQFITIDDNRPPYQYIDYYDVPKYIRDYDDTFNGDAAIVEIIVPLYSKIYSEAFQAKSFFYDLIFNDVFRINYKGSLLYRMFLASSHSFKQYLKRIDFNSKELKNLLLDICMPKFIWVIELTTKYHYSLREPEAIGLIILDSTELNVKRSVLFIGYPEVSFYPVSIGRLDEINIPLQPFKIYTNNLKKDS